MPSLGIEAVSVRSTYSCLAVAPRPNGIHHSRDSTHARHLPTSRLDHPIVMPGSTVAWVSPGSFASVFFSLRHANGGSRNQGMEVRCNRIQIAVLVGALM